jgi:hypothetical protein
MKFKKPNEYGTDDLATLPIENVQPQKSVFWWTCIGCEAKATLLHRGTAYCRHCYDKRNYNNTLVN